MTRGSSSDRVGAMRRRGRPAAGPLLAAVLLLGAVTSAGSQEPRPAGDAPDSAPGPPSVPVGALRIVNFTWHTGRVAVCAEEPGPELVQGSRRRSRTRVWVGDESGFRKVVASAASCDPTWSPNGDRLAVVTPDGLWVLSADLRRATHLVDLRCASKWGAAAARRVSRPQWAPDALSLGMVASDGTTAWVAVVDARTGALRFESAPDTHDFAWAPDSRALRLGSRRVRLPAPALPNENTRTQRCQ